MLYVGNMVEASEEQLACLAVVTPAWAEKLQKHGNYYEGIVESDKVDHILELHKRETVTSYGTRTSVASSQSKSSVDDNQKVPI